MRLLLAAALLSGMLLAQDPSRIRVTVEKQDPAAKGSAWRAVNAATVFEPADKLRFKLSTNFAGYLYVMNRGTSGSYELLFPRTDTGSENQIVANQEYVVPATQGWFKVSGPAGQDTIYWVVSPVDLGRSYRPLRPPPASGEVPPNLKPRCDDTVFKARGECIDQTAGLKPLAAGDTVPRNVRSLAGAKPREMLFMQEKGGTVLSSPQPLTGPVVYELRLAHN